MNMNSRIVLIVLGFMVLLFLLSYTWVEHYSMGAINQMNAKDAQDTHLMVGVQKHFPSCGCGSVGGCGCGRRCRCGMWNEGRSTRGSFCRF